MFFNKKISETVSDKEFDELLATLANEGPIFHDEEDDR